MTTSQPSIRLFGTDGIRAPFGTFPLDEQTVCRIGYHLGLMLIVTASILAVAYLLGRVVLDALRLDRLLTKLKRS